jgi:uncharacterized protein YukE
MASCRIVNANVEAAVEAINTISGEYGTAGTDFVSDLNNAIAEMEGEAKDAFKSFIDKDVNEFVATQLPEAIAGMASLLEANRQNFQDVDQKLATSISGT